MLEFFQGLFYLPLNSVSYDMATVKLTFQHFHCHLHDRLGAAEPIGGALYHLPKGSRAQDTTCERRDNRGSVSL